MLELFLLEHKKLWHKGTTRVCVCLLFMYFVLFGCVLSFQWFSLGSSNYTDSFGNNFDGYRMIRERQEHSRLFGGELTDESFQMMVRDYQEAEAANVDRKMQATNWIKIESWLKDLYPELKDDSSYRLMSSYVDPDELTDFYGRRQQMIEKFLEASGQEGREKEYLMQLEQSVRKPFRYEWTEGWYLILTNVVAELGVVMALFLAIILSSLFAGEWHDRTTVLMLTTRHGWGRTAAAKILAGISFTLEFFFMLAAGEIASQLFFLGTAGWDMPIQNIKLIAIAPMNMLQAEIYEYAYALLGAVGYAGIVMLLSAAVRSNALALLCSLAIVYVPVALENYLPFWLQKAADLIPLAGSGTDIFRTYTLCIFGRYIWTPYLLVTVPVLIGACCIPFVMKGWARRMKV